MTKRLHVVFTTIFEPRVLEELRLNAEQHAHLDEVKVWVVGDRKTPTVARDLSREASRKGLETVYLGIDEQDAWGAKFDDFYRRIPYNNETRRNLGYLRALEEGCETLLCIDDDNFPATGDFIGGHLGTGARWESELVSESSGFHNVCEYLTFLPDRPIFPRGYPFRLRGSLNAPSSITPGNPVTVGVTAGLWLNEPDIDATTWLNGKVLSKAYTGPQRVILAQDTWTPINTQNTSVTRDLIPAFFCIPMGHPVPGGSIQRYGDIWGGYFLQALLQGTHHHVSFGHPLVDHRRNPHDYVDDLRQEFWGMILTDWMLNLLKSEFKPTTSGITDRINELAAFLSSAAAERLPPWAPDSVKSFISGTAESMRTWSVVCRSISR